MLMKGCIPDPIDGRDISLGGFLDKTAVIPDDYSLVQYFDEVESQGQDPSCVGYGSVSMKEALDRMNGEYCRLSEIWLYDQCKRRDGEPFEGGTTIRTAMKILAKVGCAPYEFVVNVGSYYFGKFEYLNIPQELTNPFRIRTYARLFNIDEMCRCLYQHGPFAIGIKVTDEFENFKGPDIVPVHYGSINGGHCVSVAGYSKTRETLLIHNSWDKDWGVNGYAEIPFEYWQRFGMDAWGIVDISPNEA
jgi:Papain family cysteine protease